MQIKIVHSLFAKVLDMKTREPGGERTGETEKVIWRRESRINKVKRRRKARPSTVLIRLMDTEWIEA
jgi:hypothetical protein